MRKLGCFYISRSLLNEGHFRLKELFGKMIILEAVYKFAMDNVYYTAVSDHFEEVEQGHMGWDYMIKYVSSSQWEFIKMIGQGCELDENHLKTYLYTHKQCEFKDLDEFKALEDK